jgi:hypothetical protein
MEQCVPWLTEAQVCAASRIFVVANSNSSCSTSILLHWEIGRPGRAIGELLWRETRATEDPALAWRSTGTTLSCRRNTHDDHDRLRQGSGESAVAFAKAEAHDAHDETDLRFPSCSSPFRQAQGDPEPCRGVAVFLIIVIAVVADQTFRSLNVVSRDVRSA